MSTIESINNILSSQTATNGWDALVVYNREKINSLLRQQYIAKVKAGTHYQPFSHTTQTTDTGYSFESLVLGPPLISFENSSIQDSKLTVRMMFTGGSFIQTDNNGNVVQWDRYTPASRYGLNITIELKYGTGKVSDNGKISLDLTEGQIYAVEGINGLPADVILAFQNLLKEQPVSYDLGELKHDDTQNKLYPVEFVIRTQKYPGSNALASTDNTDGAVLVFVQTEYGGKGKLPADNDSQPWILPDNKTAALLISDKLLYGALLAESFENRINDLKWTTSGDEAKHYLNFTDGYVPTTNVISYSWNTVGASGVMTSSDISGNGRPARLSMAGFQLKKGDNNNTIVGTFSSAEFTDTFRGTATTTNGSWDHVKDVTFKREGQFKAKLQLDGESNVIFSGNADFTISSASEDWNPLWGENATKNFASEATSNLNKNGIFDLNSIKTFYLRSVLFPDDNILTFSEVYNPGELALYGDISQSRTALTITPAETIIACGQTLQFNASLADGSTPKELAWSVDGVGSIDASGLYKAPAKGEITQTKNVIVTATTTNGFKSTSLVTVLVSAVDVGPAFVKVKEVKGSTTSSIQFTAHQVGATEQTITWKIDPLTSNLGSIDAKSGIYTPPSAYDKNEPSIVGVIASLPSREEARAIICLWGSEIELDFPAKPPYTLNVTEKSTVNLSTENRHFDAEKWTVYPAKLGSMSEPVKQVSEDKMRTWTCDYKAPDKITQSQLVFIKITQDEPDGVAGYSLVELQPPASLWSRVTNLSKLEISTVGSSAGEAEIYGNSLNQATLLITMNAQDENSEDVILAAEDILPYIKLIDYNTGDEISVANAWSYTDKINEYNIQPTVRSGTMVIPLYVTASKGALKKDIAVQVHLINSSASYKYYSTARNSNTGMDSKVTVKTLQSINYSDKSNISYGSGELVKVKGSLLVDVIDGDNSKPEYTGECSMCFVEVMPSKQLNTTFKSVSVNYQAVLNETVNTDTQSWGVVVDEASFSCLSSDMIKCCSVTGYLSPSGGTADSGLESSAMIFFDAAQFHDGKSPGLDGRIYFKDEKKKYRVTVKDIPDYQSGSSNPGFIGYMIKVPFSGLRPLGWKNTLNPVTVDVTDEYGNSGHFTLRWDDFQNYVTPAVI